MGKHSPSSKRDKREKQKARRKLKFDKIPPQQMNEGSSPQLSVGHAKDSVSMTIFTMIYNVRDVATTLQKTMATIHKA